MADVTMSSKNQIVVPREAREALHLKPGSKLRVVVRGDVAILFPAPGKYSEATAGLAAGLYPATYLAREREGWR